MERRHGAGSRHGFDGRFSPKGEVIVLSLHATSIAVFLCIVSVALALSMTLLWRWERTRHGFGLWTLAQWLFAVGMLFLLARTILPLFWSVLLGNAGVLAALVLLRAGLQRYRDREIDVFFDAALASICLGTLLVLFSMDLALHYRVALATGICAVLALRAAVVLAHPPRLLRLAFGITATILVLIAIQGAALSAMGLFDFGGTTSIFDGGAARNLLSAGLSAATILLPFAFLLLNSLRNLDRLRLAQAEAETAASTDYLTGLPNRRRMFRELGALGPDAPVAISVLDIDDFKRINDRYGHSVGDRVLAQLGCLMLEATDGDEIPVRLGGEEFALVSLTGAWERHCRLAERVSERIEAELAARAAVDESLTCSIGVAHGRAADIDAILGYADAALYEAKRTGKNRVVRNPDAALPGVPLDGPHHVSYRIPG